MDDITFCSSDCDCIICYRHPKNIKEPQYPHSYADFKGQGMCPMESKNWMGQILRHEWSGRRIGREKDGRYKLDRTNESCV